jgi:hypothetical protein
MGAGALDAVAGRVACRWLQLDVCRAARQGRWHCLACDAGPRGLAALTRP